GLARGAVRHRDHAPHEGGVAVGDVGDGGDVLEGDHQQMYGRLGVDVAEHEEFVVAVDDVALDLAGANLAEDAVRGHGRLRLGLRFGRRWAGRWPSLGKGLTSLGRTLEAVARLYWNGRDLSRPYRTPRRVGCVYGRCHHARVSPSL